MKKLENKFSTTQRVKKRKNERCNTKAERERAEWLPLVRFFITPYNGKASPRTKTYEITQDNAADKGGCGIEHCRKFDNCKNDVIYSVALHMGKRRPEGLMPKRSPWQTRKFIKRAPHSHLAIDFKEWMCQPEFDKPLSLESRQSGLCSKLTQAFLIKKGGRGCVSQTSILFG